MLAVRTLGINRQAKRVWFFSQERLFVINIGQNSRAKDRMPEAG